MQKVVVETILSDREANALDLRANLRLIKIGVKDLYVFSPVQRRTELIESFRAGKSSCPIFVGDWVLCESLPSGELEFKFVVLSDGDRRKCLF